MNKTMLAALALLLPSLCLAQQDAPVPAAPTAPAAGSPDVQKDKAGVSKDEQDLSQARAALKSDKAQLKALLAQKKAAKADLRAKEAAAVEGVRSDASLTEAQKKAKIKTIHQDYRGQRKALETQYASKAQALRGGVEKDADTVRQDRAGLQQDRGRLRKDRQDARAKR